MTENQQGDFEAFWKLYPRRVAKGQARKAFAKALKKASLADLLSALEEQKAYGLGRDPLYTKHPATWLNGECWLDELVPVNGAPAAPEGEVYGF